MKKSDAPHTLLDMRRSVGAVIVSLPNDPALRSQCIRLGLAIGAHVRCIERLPGGTVVLSTNRQEIALGRALALEIGVATSGISSSDHSTSGRPHTDVLLPEQSTSTPGSSISDLHIQ